MTRIVEHRSALPNGLVVEVHVRRGSEAEVLASVDVTLFGARVDPDLFPTEPLPAADAFL